MDKLTLWLSQNECETFCPSRDGQISSGHWQELTAKIYKIEKTIGLLCHLLYSLRIILLLKLYAICFSVNLHSPEIMKGYLMCITNVEEEELTIECCLTWLQLPCVQELLVPVFAGFVCV